MSRGAPAPVAWAAGALALAFGFDALEQAVMVRRLADDRPTVAPPARGGR